MTGAERSPYRSARLRVTAVSALVVFVVLAVAGWAVAEAHQRSLRSNLEETLARAADDLRRAVAEGRPITTIGFGDDDAAYQVVDGRGEVVASSPNLDDVPAITPPPGGEAEAVRTITGTPFGDGEAFVLRSEVVDGDVVVHVAAPLDDIDESAAALRRAFLVAVPLTTAVLAIAVWFLVGRLLRRAEAASVRQQRFVADASHELRNPLTRMRTELEVDLAHPGRAEPLATHRVVLAETVGLQRLVDDLLQLARLDEGLGTGTATREVVDLDAVVGRVARDLRATGTVDVDTTGVAPAQVRGQPDQLRRVVANLADNAARHARGAVRFEVAERDGHAVVAVSDDGPGIPAPDRERVFERFSRLDEARSGASGSTGLGLAIAREIVQRHGGTIAVDPGADPGTDAGARLVVELPLA